MTRSKTYRSFQFPYFFWFFLTFFLFFLQEHRRQRQKVQNSKENAEGCTESKMMLFERDCNPENTLLDSSSTNDKQRTSEMKVRKKRYVNEIISKSFKFYCLKFVFKFYCYNCLCIGKASLFFWVTNFF